MPELVLSGMVLAEPVVPVVEPLVPLSVVEGLVVEGMVDEDEPGIVTVSSFLLQPPNARAAVKASTTAKTDLIVDVHISVSFF